jgi:hypothetical protein
MTNYTTKRKQTLTRKMWGFVVYLLYCAIFSYIATATLLQHYKQKMCVEIAYLSLELPNKSAKTFLFASSTLRLSGII